MTGRMFGKRDEIRGEKRVHATRLRRVRAMERNEQSREPVTIRVIATSKFKKTKSRIRPKTLSTFKNANELSIR